MALVAVDFDGTLSESDVTVLLAEEHGVRAEVAGLAEQGRLGEVDFVESLRERVSLLEGLQRDGVEEAFERIRLRDGAADLLAALERSDADVAIITGSFERGVQAALDRAQVGVDELVANRLGVENGALSGEVTGPLVDGRKDAALEEVLATRDVDLDRTIAVGDDETDRPMLRAAATGIGFDPAGDVDRHCDEVVHSVRELRDYLEQHGVIAAE